MSIWSWFGSDRLKEYEARTDAEPGNPAAHFELGAEYDRRGLYHKAIAAFERTLELNPRSAEAHYNLGILYQSVDNGGKAVFHMAQAGNLFSERNDTDSRDKARARLKALHQQFPNSARDPR